jgi:hypothetical protein
MIAGLRVAALPLGWIIWILEHSFHLDKDHKTPVFISTALAMVCVLFLIVSAVFSGRWFHHLFYRGELWGYRPESKDNSN